MLNLDVYDFKKAFKLTPILLAVLILAHAPPTQAALLCSYSGPDSADGYLELSDFEVTGPEPLRMGDTVTVSFTLKAIEVPIQFGEQGAFVAVKDPDDIDGNFGHVHQDHWLSAGKSISVEASTTVDKEGEWIFWPSYHIVENPPYYYGEHFAPDEWHACYLTTKSQPDLTVEEIFWDPPLPAIGESVTVTVVVMNSGVPSSEWAYLTLGGCCDLSSQVRPLEPDETATIYFEDSPLIFEESGEFEITATIDAANEIAESNEANNEGSEVITVERVLPPLSVSIFTDPVPSGESYEVAVLVTADGDPVQDVFVSLSATTGDLDPDAGTTGAEGGFVSIFTAPAAHAETRYTIYAEAEIEDRAGEGSVSNMITVPRELPPTAYMGIYPNPVYERERVTLMGWSMGAEGGEVVECRWTLPNGSILPYPGGSSQLTLEPDEVQAGVYHFAVRGDDGIWSKEVEEELGVVRIEFPTKPTIPEVIAEIAVLAAGVFLIYRAFRKPLVHKLGPNPKKKKDKNESGEDKGKHGSILATSDPSDAVVFVDGAYKGRSPKTIDNVLIGPHTVMFLKRDYFGYEKNTVAVDNQTTPVHRDLTKMPEVKLKLSSDPAEIAADGKSRSTIEIGIVTKDKEIPIPVLEELTVVLEADIGTIDSPVRIPCWHASTISTLRSSRSSGTATVKVGADYWKIVKLRGSTTVEFLDAESE